MVQGSYGNLAEDTEEEREEKDDRKAPSKGSSQSTATLPSSRPGKDSHSEGRIPAWHTWPGPYLQLFGTIKTTSPGEISPHVLALGEIWGAEASRAGWVVGGAGACCCSWTLEEGLPASYDPNRQSKTVQICLQ